MGEPALKPFGEDTWKDIQDRKERLTTDQLRSPAYKALLAFADAIEAFTTAAPGGKWRERRIEFGRLVKDPQYASDFAAGYEQGKRSGMKDTLGADLTEVKNELVFYTPSLAKLAEIYLQRQGTAPTGQDLREALGRGPAAAVDIYGSPIGSLGSAQSKADLLSSTWFKAGIAAAKLCDEVERQGWLATIEMTVTQVLEGLRRLSEGWLDGFFALNGSALKQGEYAGRMIGFAIAQVIWAAANDIAFNAASRAFIVPAEGLPELYERVRSFTLKQRLAGLVVRTRRLVEWLEQALRRDIPEIFYRVFVRGEPKAIEGFSEAAARFARQRGSVVARARGLKGGYIFEELIAFNERWEPRVKEIETFLTDAKDLPWQPKAYRARRIWVWQYNGFTKQAEWIELGDNALVVFPKPGVETPYKIGLANLFESKSAGVVDKATVSPEFLAGQIGKDFERLDSFVPEAGKPAYRFEIEGLLGGTDTTLVEFEAGELFLSRQAPRIEKIGEQQKHLFGTYWTVVAPPDAPGGSLGGVVKNLKKNGFSAGELWLHPITDSTAQKIAEAAIEFSDNNP